ncbi:type I-U CRISPR-associated protein Cas5/Cas6 [bacterium]|nr:type I-U CRISPR-associated protein Cas5/Cas6 [candidate division CSSED10-310 bacterium]
MLAIKFFFLTGKYHATPWDNHVNEGVVEWPPSNWRIIRSLIAVWYKQGCPGNESCLHRLLEKLSSAPEYHVCETTQGHTRHYMPKYRTPLDKKTDKVFDTFQLLNPKEPLIVIWQSIKDMWIKQSDYEMNLLRKLLRGLTYLGRAESWVHAVLNEPDDNDLPKPNIIKIGLDNDENISNGDQKIFIRRLTPFNWQNYPIWRNNELQLFNEKDREKMEKIYPKTVWDALQMTTSELQKTGWSNPPGSQWITYSVKETDVARVKLLVRQVKKTKYTTARFTLTSSVKPRITDSLYIGERMRQALMAHSKTSRESNDVSVVFSGKDLNGCPLKNDHKHSFFLPEDADGDGLIDHLTVYAEGGFDDKAIKAFGTVRKLWGEGDHDLLLALIGIGSAEDFGGMNSCIGQSPFLAKSRYWISATPYFMTRHPKYYRNGKPKLDEKGIHIDGPDYQIRKEMMYRKMPVPKIVSSLNNITVYGRQLRSIHFGNTRKNRNQRPNLPGLFFFIEFETEIQGPIALGYACHFGLGQFRAVSHEI